MESLAMTGDGKIHVIADSDTVVVAKGWDDCLRHKLLNEGNAIVGTTYEDIGGFSSGTNTVQTYKKIPALTWCALSPMHDWHDLEVMPNKAHQVEITTPELAGIYNLPTGYSVFGEVGWQLPMYLHEHGLKYEGWRQLKPSGEAIVLKGLSDYHEEFHVGNVPFITHHRGSLRHLYREDPISCKFYNAVDAYLAMETTRAPRFSWSESHDKVVPKFRESCVETMKIVDDAQKMVPRGKEWLKVSFNGTVVRPRTSVDRSQPQVQLKIERPSHDRIGHIRVEGVLEFSFPLVLPPAIVEPYMVTCRNVTGAPLMVNCGGRSLALPPNKTWFLLVDVDGVKRVE